MLDRRLAYRDRFVKQLVQELDTGDCEGESLILNSGVNTIILDLTEQQWVKLFSAIMTGADLTYPSEAHQVTWSFLRGVECALNFCQRMIDCFVNDEDVREAMIQALIAELLADPVQREAFVSAMGEIGVGLSSGGNSTGSPNGLIDGKTYDDSCDEDVLYGKAFAIVEALNIVSENVLEVIEVLTNPNELVAELSDNIPALGAILGTVGDVATWLQDTIAEVYQASYNTTTKEYFACAIYCNALEDCELSFGLVRQTYRDEYGGDFPPPDNSDLATVLEWLISIPSMISARAVGAMHLFCLEVLARAGYIYGDNFRIFEIATETATPIEPLCEDCLTYCHKIDFTVTDGGFTGVGTWVSGTGWKPAQNVGATARHNLVGIALSHGFTFDFTSIEIVYTADVVLNETSRQNSVRAMLDGFEQSIGSELAVSQPTPHTLTNNNPASCNSTEIAVYAASKNGTGAFDPGDLGDCTLLSITYRGEGENPFGSDNC